MIHIFNNILEKLDTIPELQWIDMEKGQMNSSRPTIAFPAALISVLLPRTANITKLEQTVDATVVVRLCFNFQGKTNNKMEATERAKSLAYYNLVDTVYKALQGFETADMNALERMNAVEEVRPDEYKVVQLNFKTAYVDADAVI